MPKSMFGMVSVADFVSIINVIFGFLSIIMVLNSKIYLAFTFILLGILADGLDGIISRKTKPSEIGEYFESMADMTTTGVAVSIFIYFSYYEIVSCCVYKQTLLILLLVLYLSMNVIRLASFSVLKNKDYFVGLPAPASAIMLIVLAYVGVDIIFIQIALILLSLLIVSNIHFIKPRLKIDLFAFLLIILAIIFADMYNYIFSYLLFIGMIIYVLIGSIYLMIRKK